MRRCPKSPSWNALFACCADVTAPALGLRFDPGREVNLISGRQKKRTTGLRPASESLLEPIRVRLAGMTKIRRGRPAPLIRRRRRSPARLQHALPLLASPRAGAPAHPDRSIWIFLASASSLRDGDFRRLGDTRNDLAGQAY